MTLAHPPGIDVAARPTGGKTACTCVRWHRPVPAEDVGHHPVPTGQPFFGAKSQALIWLCPTTHASVHACIRVHLHARMQDREPTAVELRPFTRYVRALAQVAMDALGPQADIPLDP